MIKNEKDCFELPPLTKQEVIKRIELMKNNCNIEEVKVKLSDVISYVKRLKDS